MKVPDIENHDMKRHIQNYRLTENELFLDLIYESLKESKFIVPFHSGSYVTLRYESEGHFIIPVFTDYDEYAGGRELLERNGIAVSQIRIVDISNFIEFGDSLFFKGILIDMGSESYHVSAELLDLIRMESQSCSYSSQQLKQIMQLTDNRDLVRHLKSERNTPHCVSDELITALSKSLLFSLVTSRTAIDDHLENGVVDINHYPEHIDDISLIVTETDIGECFVLLTDRDEIRNSKNDIISQNPNTHIYSKIANISHICDFILNADLDGLIINPSSDSYFLSSEALKKSYRSMRKLSLDSSLNRSESCIFNIK